VSETIHKSAQAFVSAAFAILRQEHVIPTPIYQPHIAVGRDYFGASINNLVEYRSFESALNDGFPERFADPLARATTTAEFSSTYIYRFLEACVALCSENGDYSADADAVSVCVDELIQVLKHSQYDVICCRTVSHLTTGNGDELQIGSITIVPEQGFSRNLLYRIAAEIPGAATAWNREPPTVYDPPVSLLIARETAENDPYAASEGLAAQLDRFLLATRLLTAGTTQSVYQVSGLATRVSRMRPLFHQAAKGMFDLPVRRTARLTSNEGPALAAVDKLIFAANVKRDDMVATSFDVAVSNFNNSYRGSNPYEHLVSLATALEATLIGSTKDTEGLSLRLRSRSAALLATEDDPANAVFSDITQLYNLRSRLVHGGQITQKDLRKSVGKISTVSAEDTEHHFRVALGLAVDRMRDLVRRAILARLCLAADPEARWPLHGDTPVDEILSDDVQRSAWRSEWHAHLDRLGLAAAAAPARSAVDVLQQEDR
jgi:hypothetical protein